MTLGFWTTVIAKSAAKVELAKKNLAAAEVAAAQATFNKQHADACLARAQLIHSRALEEHSEFVAASNALHTGSSSLQYLHPLTSNTETPPAFKHPRRRRSSRTTSTRTSSSTSRRRPFSTSSAR